MKNKKKVAVVGAGFYGAEIALSLSSKYEVTVFEKAPAAFSSVSQNSGARSSVSQDFGARIISSGDHYPKSKVTREQCKKGAKEFREKYPELLRKPDKVVYGISQINDPEGHPSKITVEQFKLINEENAGCYTEINLENSEEYQNLLYAVDVTGTEEQSVVFGKGRQDFFQRRFEEKGIHTQFNCTVKSIEKEDKGFKVIGNMQSGEELSQSFDMVINATSYQDAFTEKSTEFLGIKIGYQVCIALMYEDKERGKPFLFTVMDGKFPCMMSYPDESNGNPRYIVTHAKFTIMGPYSSAAEAQEQLSHLNDNYINEKIRMQTEHELARFLKIFNPGRFEYIGWRATVLAKTSTHEDFRSGFVYINQKGFFEVFPGKISDIFACAREVKELLKDKNALENKNIIENEGYRYVKGGILDKALRECVQNHPEASNPPISQNSHAFLPMSGNVVAVQGPIPAHAPLVGENNFAFLRSPSVTSIFPKDIGFSAVCRIN